MGTSLEGVSLHVADVEKSVSFYSKLPSAQLLMHRPGHFAKFKLGEGHIQVVAIPPDEKCFHMEMNAPDLHVLGVRYGLNSNRWSTKAKFEVLIRYGALGN